MVNKWELFFTFSDCGSGTYEELNYVLNNSGTVVRYGTRQIPCDVPIANREEWMRNEFISALRGYMGLTDLDEIWVNRVLYQPRAKPSPCPPKGDIDNDGYISVLDVQHILNIAVGQSGYTEEQKARADLDGSGSVMASDSLMAQRFLNGQIDTFPICNPCIPNWQCEFGGNTGYEYDVNSCDSTNLRRSANRCIQNVQCPDIRFVLAIY